MATTCDFPAIKNPLDEAMRTCFICAINNEAILKSVFREKEEKLTFAKSVEIATEVEEAARTAKAQVYSKPDEVQMIHTKKPQRNNHHHHHQKSPPSTKPSASTTARCYRCGKNGHAMKDCRLSVFGLKRIVKSCLVQNYSYYCAIPNCYVCQLYVN